MPCTDRYLQHLKPRLSKPVARGNLVSQNSLHGGEGRKYLQELRF